MLQAASEINSIRHEATKTKMLQVIKVFFWLPCSSDRRSRSQCLKSPCCHVANLTYLVSDLAGTSTFIRTWQSLSFQSNTYSDCLRRPFKPLRRLTDQKQSTKSRIILL